MITYNDTHGDKNKKLGRVDVAYSTGQYSQKDTREGENAEKCAVRCSKYR